MNSPAQPTRLKASSDVLPGLRSALREAEQDGATAEQLRRLQACLPMATGGQGGQGGGGPSGPVGIAASATAWKVLAFVLVGGVLVGGVWVSQSENREPEAVSAPAPPVSVTIAPPFDAPIEVEVAASASAPMPSATGSGKIRLESSKAAIPSETALLDEARRSLSTRPERTLSLTRRHRQLYPQGMLAQEREVLEVEALARLGRTREAQREADRFRDQHPDSVHGNRVEKTVGAEAADSSGAR